MFSLEFYSRHVSHAELENPQFSRMGAHSVSTRKPVTSLALTNYLAAMRNTTEAEDRGHTERGPVNTAPGSSHMD